jgi:hypothetical protein
MLIPFDRVAEWVCSNCGTSNRQEQYSKAVLRCCACRRVYSASGEVYLLDKRIEELEDRIRILEAKVIPDEY